AANTGAVTASGIPITGQLTGTFQYTLDFSNRTLDFDASLDGPGGVFTGPPQSLQSVQNSSAITFGPNSDFPVDGGSDCTTCAVEFRFPSTGS
ncbi:hypothetical protein SB717_35405, partial [Priestia sp. SIMBA_032]|uniref:hypothetical protein n=1 Tax=Priestia sp. SIMBA_032 TaxID=3085775 RepID=UPI00397A0A35